MSSENIKKIYVLNLDKTRIAIISCALFILFSLSFFVGFRWNYKTSDHALAGQIEGNQAVNDKNEAIDSLLQPKNVVTLPEEDNQILSKSFDSEDDPFLIDPPLKASKENNVNSPNRKNQGKLSVAEKHSPPTVRKMEKQDTLDKKYYTIQLAAFEHEKDALAYKKELTKKGLDARVDHGKLYYFVRVGKTNEKAELETLYKKIHDTMKLQSVLVQRKIS